MKKLLQFLVGQHTKPFAKRHSVAMQGLSPWPILITFLFVLEMIFACGVVQAQTTYDWKDTAPDGNWKQGAGGARWWPGDLWDEPSLGNILRFNNNHQLSMNNNVSSYSVHQIIFGSGNTSSRTISGNNLSVNDWSGADPKIENSSTGGHTISLNLTGDSNDPLEINPVSGNLTISGTINNNGSAINVYGNNDKMLTLSGVVSGSGGLNVKQNSLVQLSGNNTYSGATAIEAGRVRILHANSLGNTSAGTTVSSGAALEIWGAINPAAEPLTLNGTGISSAGAFRKRDTGDSTFGGAITLGAWNVAAARAWAVRP